MSLPHEALAANGEITHASLPFTLRVIALCANCRLDEDAGNQPVLKPVPAKLDDEINQLGLAFKVILSGTEKEFSTTEFLATQPELLLDNHNYRFVLRRRHRELPFSLMLENLQQNYYQGTQIAQNYASSLSVIEEKHEWPVLISMNNPFRYKGYTFYQSSILTLPDNETASVLNVVDNAGWLFPYVGTFLLFAGLSLHAWMRRNERK